MQRPLLSQPFSVASYWEETQKIPLAVFWQLGHIFQLTDAFVYPYPS